MFAIFGPGCLRRLCGGRHAREHVDIVYLYLCENRGTVNANGCLLAFGNVRGWRRLTNCVTKCVTTVRQTRELGCSSWTNCVKSVWQVVICDKLCDKCVTNCVTSCKLCDKQCDRLWESICYGAGDSGSLMKCKVKWPTRQYWHITTISVCCSNTRVRREIMQTDALCSSNIAGCHS